MQHLQDPLAVGVSGALTLYAEAADLRRGEKNGPAQVYNQKTGEWSHTMPLQAWFKWRTWQEPSQHAPPQNDDGAPTGVEAANSIL